MGRKAAGARARERLPAREGEAGVQQRCGRQQQCPGGARAPHSTPLLCSPSSAGPNQNSAGALPAPPDPQRPQQGQDTRCAGGAASNSPRRTEVGAKQPGRGALADPHAHLLARAAELAVAVFQVSAQKGERRAAACRQLPGGSGPPASISPFHQASPRAACLPRCLSYTGRCRHALGGGHPAPGEAVGQAAGRQRRRREPRGRHGAARRRGAGGEWRGLGRRAARCACQAGRLCAGASLHWRAGRTWCSRADMALLHLHLQARPNRTYVCPRRTRRWSLWWPRCWERARAAARPQCSPSASSSTWRTWQRWHRCGRGGEAPAVGPSRQAAWQPIATCNLTLLQWHAE